jgi:hypothetical protein
MLVAVDSIQRFKFRPVILSPAVAIMESTYQIRQQDVYRWQKRITLFLSRRVSPVSPNHSVAFPGWLTESSLLFSLMTYGPALLGI